MARKPSKPPKTPKEAFKLFWDDATIDKRALAKTLGITAQAMWQWEQVPHQHVLKISDETGIPPHWLRPDLHRPPETVR